MTAQSASSDLGSIGANLIGGTLSSVLGGLQKFVGSTDTDTQYVNALKALNSDNGAPTYLGAVSPWFFTHYGPDTFNKNWIYRGDDWLFASRWELLVQHRASIPFAEVVTWNDYGESHYIGPVDGAQPGSNAWVDGFDHQGASPLSHDSLLGTNGADASG